MKVTEKEIEVMALALFPHKDTDKAQENAFYGYIEGFKQAQSMNEWVEIKSKADLPKGRCYCWFFDKPTGKIVNGEYLGDKDGINYILANASHYMVYSEPSPPQT